MYKSKSLHDVEFNSSSRHFERVSRNSNGLVCTEQDYRFCPRLGKYIKLTPEAKSKIKTKQIMKSVNDFYIREFGMLPNGEESIRDVCDLVRSVKRIRLE